SSHQSGDQLGHHYDRNAHRSGDYYEAPCLQPMVKEATGRTLTVVRVSDACHLEVLPISAKWRCIGLDSENSLSTLARARRACCLIASGVESAFANAAHQAAVLPAGTKIASRSWRTNSGMPCTAEAMIGTLHAMASKITRG